MLRRSLFVACAPASLASECVYVEAREARVEVIGSDASGRAIPAVQFELTPRHPGAKATKAESGRARVLFGEYELHATATGFVGTRQILRIYQPELIVRIVLQVGYMGCPPEPAEIAGRVRRSSNGDELWVKAIPVQGSGGSEARVNSGGYFLISGLERTSYLVAVMQGETVLHHQIVKTFPITRQPTRIDIDLVNK